MTVDKSLKVRQWVIVGLAIAMSVSFVTLWYFQNSLNRKRSALKSEISKIDRKLAYSSKRFETTPSSRNVFTTIEQIFRFIEESAHSSRMTIIRLGIPESKPEPAQVMVELTVTGGYPDLIRYLNRLQSYADYFEVQTLNLLASDKPGATLQADLKLNFRIAKRGGTK